MKFTLTTDTSCDVPRGDLKKAGISYVPLTYVIDGTVFKDELDFEEEFKLFYDIIRTGALPTTSQINPKEHEQFFNSLIESGAKEIVHFCLSSGLSSTYNSAVLAANEIMSANNNVKIYVFDTLNVTHGAHFLLKRATAMRDNGKTAQEAFDALEEIKNNIHVWFMASDLMHLKRGGRVSAVAALFGTVLKIKPIIIVNKVGGLTVVQKCKGVRKSLEFLAERVVKYCHKDYKSAEIMIAHADCVESAEELTEILREKGCKGEISVGYIGPVIGSHTGAGAIGLIFEGGGRRIDTLKDLS